MKYFLRSLVLLIAISSLSACNQESLGIQDGDASAFKEAVVISQYNITDINVSASSPIITVDDTLSFSVSGISGTNRVDITGDVRRWSVSDPAIARISAEGLVTGLAEGDVTIIANIATLTASANLRITAAALESIEISSDAGLSIEACKTLQLKAMASYTGETLTQDITGQTTWTATTTSAGSAQFSNIASETGLLLTTLADTVSVAAQKGSTTGTGAVTINPFAGSIAITPISSTLATINNTTPFTARAIFSDSTESDVTRTALWATPDVVPVIATISNSLGNKGLATAKSAGIASITASCDTSSSPAATLTVDETVTLTAVTIGYNPDDVTNTDSTDAKIYIGSETSLQLSATAHYSNGNTGNITESADWFIDNITGADPLPLSVDDNTGNKGLITITNNGTVIVSISYQESGATVTNDANITIVVTRP